jgi:F0F1-type ATP synthase membrane subunit b/b'
MNILIKIFYTIYLSTVICFSLFFMFILIVYIYSAAKRKILKVLNKRKGRKK